MDELRSTTQVLILSDTFDQFAMPLMKKLGYPTLLCNTLEVAPDGDILGMSRWVQALENELGVMLLSQEPGGVVLTADGRLLPLRIEKLRRPP